MSKCLNANYSLVNIDSISCLFLIKKCLPEKKRKKGKKEGKGKGREDIKKEQDACGELGQRKINIQVKCRAGNKI